MVLAKIALPPRLQNNRPQDLLRKCFDSVYSSRVIRKYSLLLLAVSLVSAAPKQTALDRYVAAPDSSFKYSVVKKTETATGTVTVLDMTSQTWRKPDEINRTEWRHWVNIARPAKLTSSIAFLFITGGSNLSPTPGAMDPRLLQIAESLGAVTIEVKMVPNQPLVFLDDPQKKQRVEDSFIAYTWNKYMATGDETWPARLPMTKAAVRAMDAATAYLASAEGGAVKIDRFVVAGGSKRGWTTWTTAAVDKRVVAIAPLVIDLLNMVPSFVHHYRAYGFWAPSIFDYYEQGIMDRTDDPKYKKLLAITEPYSYKERFTMPKFMVNAAGDQFFLPDSWKFYFRQLKGEKHLRYVPNADHSLRNSDAWESVIAFYESVIKGTRRPDLDWKLEKDGSLRVTSKDKPTAVKLWQATNPDARDFRLETLGPVYKSKEVPMLKDGVWLAKPEKPAKGYSAYFVEMTFASGGQFPFKFTTGVHVTPDTYPYGPPVKGQTKIGPLPKKN